MHVVILAAGEGSRMQGLSDGVPKAFMELEERTIYERQRALLDGHVDAVTVALGYAAENVRDEVGDAEALIVDEWDEYDNAESLRRALAALDDDVLVLNGDVLVTETALTRVLERHRETTGGCNAVACIPGHQKGSTAVLCDDSGIVTDYGAIRGHRHAGLGVVDRANVAAAERFLRAHRDEWYPVVYPEFETEMVPIRASQHVEINYPRDLVAARRKLPSLSSGEVDAQT